MRLTLIPFNDAHYGDYTVDDPPGAKALIDEEATVSGHAATVVAGMVDDQMHVGVTWHGLPPRGFEVEIIDRSCFDSQLTDGLDDTHEPWCSQSMADGTPFTIDNVAAVGAKIDAGIKITLV